MSKSVVISAKVEPDIALAIRNKAKFEGKSVSTLLSELVQTVDAKRIVKASKEIEPINQFLEDIGKMSTVFGGSALAGILSYKAIKAVLTDAQVDGRLNFTNQEIEMVAYFLGIASALLTGAGISTLLSDKR
jgi:hypothetical protein